MTKRLYLSVMVLVVALMLAACDSAAPEPAQTEADAPAEATVEPVAQAETTNEEPAPADTSEAAAASTEEPATAEPAEAEPAAKEAADQATESGMSAIDAIAAGSLIPDADIVSEAAAAAAMPVQQYGLVVGQLNDKGFNELAWAGMQQAEAELGVGVQYLQDTNAGTVKTRITQFLNQGVDGIVTVGVEMARATKEAAEANPNVPFAIVDFPDQTATDRGLLFDVDAPAFMAGYLAAGMSQSGTVCTYGGRQIPPVLIFMVGFEQGVDYYNNQNEAEVNVLGWHTDPTIAVGGAGVFAGSFTDQVFGRSIAVEFANRGCDIIFPVAGGVGLGTAEVAAENGLTVIGVDADQSLSNPDYADVYLTSVIKRIDRAVFEAISQMVDGTFEGGSSYIGTLENEGVDLAPFNSFEDQVPQTLKDDLETIRQGLIDGTISTGWPIGVSKIQTSAKAGNLTLAALRNAVYADDYTADGTAPLTNGEYREPDAGTVVKLGDQLGYGDLNGDGQDEAVTFIVSDIGGGDILYNLVVVADVDGAPTEVGRAFLGDGIIIKSLAVEKGLIGLVMVTQGPNDPFNAPTQEVIKFFGLQDNELVELASQVVE
ncbi:MAG: BMP family ABC transporter substrate-binding protein [Anaerolineae bacterium]|nr:BMP family ABC transporter substrate-binding protein [Anaerolineae bacterium]